MVACLQAKMYVPVLFECSHRKEKEKEKSTDGIAPSLTDKKLHAPVDVTSSDSFSSSRDEGSARNRTGIQAVRYPLNV